MLENRCPPPGAGGLLVTACQCLGGDSRQLLDMQAGELDGVTEGRVGDHGGFFTSIDAQKFRTLKCKS